MIDADSNYSFNPWMRPEQRLGDDVDPSPVLSPVETIYGIMLQSPMPPPAGITPRLGYPQGEPGVVDVLGVGPNTLMRDTPTSQDSGQPGTLRDSLAHY